VCTSLPSLLLFISSHLPSLPPLEFISKLSWTCFDPSLINNLIGSPGLANNQLGTSQSPIAAISHHSAFGPESRLARVTLPPPFACEVQMSTQPPNPQLMGRTNVAMAVAQPKPKPVSKANSNTPKGKAQMHRRSRTGLLKFIFP
jgi:hypothetical protein